MRVRHRAATATDSTVAPADSASSVSCDSASSNDEPGQKPTDKKTKKRKRARPTLNAVDFIDDAAVLSGSEISDDSGEGLEGDEDRYEEDGFLVFSDGEVEMVSRRRRNKKKKRSGRGKKKKAELELNEDDLLLIKDARGSVIPKNPLSQENGRLVQKGKHQRQEERRAKGQSFRDEEQDCFSLENGSSEEVCETDDSESSVGSGVPHRPKVPRVYARERCNSSDSPLNQRNAAAGRKSSREQKVKTVKLRKTEKIPRRGEKNQSPNELDSFPSSGPRRPYQTRKPDQPRKVEHKSHSGTKMQERLPGGQQSFRGSHKISHNPDGRCKERRSSKLFGFRQRPPAQLVEPAQRSSQPKYGLASLEPSTQELTARFRKTSLPSQKTLRRTCDVNQQHDRSIVLPSTTQHRPSSVSKATSGSAKPAAHAPQKKNSPRELSRPQVGVGKTHLRHLSKPKWQAGKGIVESRSHPSHASLMQPKSGLSSSGSQRDTTAHGQLSAHDPCRRSHGNSKRASLLNHLTPNCFTQKVRDQAPTAGMRVQVSGRGKKYNRISVEQGRTEASNDNDVTEEQKVLADMTAAKRIEDRKRHRQSALKTPEALSRMPVGSQKIALNKLQPIENLSENKGQRSQNVPRRHIASALGARSVHKRKRPDASEKPQLLFTNEKLCRKPTKRRERLPKPPSACVQDRVAKKFDGVTYFGTITTCVKRKNNVTYWHVNYDDGDSEDYDNTDLCEAIELYKRRQADDPELSQQKLNSATNSSQSTRVKGLSVVKKNHPEPASPKVTQRFTKSKANAPKQQNCNTVISSAPTLGQVPRKKNLTEVSPASSGRLPSAAARSNPCIPAAPTTQLLDPELSQKKRNSTTNSPQSTIAKGMSMVKKNHPEPASAKVTQRFTKPKANAPKQQNCNTVISSAPTLGQVPRKKNSTEVSPASSSGRLSSATARSNPGIPAAPTTQLLSPSRAQNQPSCALTSSALAGRKTLAFGNINAPVMAKEMASTSTISANKTKITRKQKSHCLASLIQTVQLEKKKEQRNLGVNDSHNNSARNDTNVVGGKEASFEGRHSQLPQEPQFHNGNFPSSHETHKNALASTRNLAAGSYILCQTAMSESYDASRKSVDVGCAVTPPNNSAGCGTCENGDGGDSREGDITGTQMTMNQDDQCNNISGLSLSVEHEKDEVGMDMASDWMQHKSQRSSANSLPSRPNSHNSSNSATCAGVNTSCEAIDDQETHGRSISDDVPFHSDAIDGSAQIADEETISGAEAVLRKVGSMKAAKCEDSGQCEQDKNDGGVANLIHVLTSLGEKYAGECKNVESRSLFLKLAHLNPKTNTSQFSLPLIVNQLCTKIGDLERDITNLERRFAARAEMTKHSSKQLCQNNQPQCLEL